MTSRGLNVKPRTGDATVSARRASTRRMKCGALEDEVARLTPWSRDDEALPGRADAALNVFEILLENADGQTELAPQVIKVPLALTEEFENLLSTRLASCHGRLPKRSIVPTSDVLTF